MVASKIKSKKLSEKTQKDSFIGKKKKSQMIAKVVLEKKKGSIQKSDSDRSSAKKRKSLQASHDSQKLDSVEEKILKKSKKASLEKQVAAESIDCKKSKTSAQEIKKKVMKKTNPEKSKKSKPVSSDSSS
eukprot:Sdes_comp15898_c0_seq1m5021